MPLGNLENEGDLKRWMDKNYPPPPPKPDVSLSKEGVPTDEDFPNTPGDGTTAYDEETGTLYIRNAGEWKPI